MNYIAHHSHLLKSLRTRALAVIAIFLAVLGAGCDARRDESARIDVQWHKSNLADGLLPRWLAAAPGEAGFLRTSFDRSWNAKAEQPGYLTEHARLVYSLIVGYGLARDKRYLDAANRGADFLLARFRDPVHGGFFLRVAPDGKVLYDTKNTYGHAFALLALSHMARVTGEARYRAAALTAWRDIDLWLRDGKGGFFGQLPRDFSKTGAVEAATPTWATSLNGATCCGRPRPGD